MKASVICIFFLKNSVLNCTKIQVIFVIYFITKLQNLLCNLLDFCLSKMLVTTVNKNIL